MDKIKHQVSYRKRIFIFAFVFVLFSALFLIVQKEGNASNEKRPIVNIIVTKSGDAQNSKLNIQKNVTELIQAALNPLASYKKIDIDISIKGRGIGSNYQGSTHYTGANVSGRLILNIDDNKIIKFFEGEDPVSGAVSSGSFLKPTDAPFGFALMEPGSLYDMLVVTIKQVWGYEALMRVILDCDYYPLKRFSMEQLESRDPASSNLVSEDFLKNILKDMAESPKAEYRANIAMLLGATRDNRALDMLINKVPSGNDIISVRRVAIDALSKLKSPKSIDVLIPVLSEDDFDLKLRAIHALGELRAKKAVEPLIVLLNSNAHGAVKEKAMEALGKIGDMRAANALIPFTDVWNHKHEAEKALQLITGIMPSGFSFNGTSSKWWATKISKIQK